MSYLDMNEGEIHTLVERGGLDDYVFFGLHKDARELQEEFYQCQAAYNAVLDYVLGKGRMESPMEFLHCWNEGDFEALRIEWPDAPEEIYFADPLGSHPLYKGKK